MFSPLYSGFNRYCICGCWYYNRVSAKYNKDREEEKTSFTFPCCWWAGCWGCCCIERDGCSIFKSHESERFEFWLPTNVCDIFFIFLSSLISNQSESISSLFHLSPSRARCRAREREKVRETRTNEDTTSSTTLLLTAILHRNRRIRVSGSSVGSHSWSDWFLN